MSEKTIRLNKALKELNISMGRAVDFLQSQNIEIENRPTAKISTEVYTVLQKEFRKDMLQKEASEEVVLNKLPEKKPEEIKVATPPPAPTPVPQPEEKEKEEVAAAPTPIEEKVSVTEQTPEPEKVKEVVIESIIEKTSKEEEIKPVKSNISSGHQLKGPKQIGKISLDKLDASKKKPSAKKKQEVKQEKPKQKQAVTPKPVEQKPAIETPSKEKQVEVTSEAPKKEVTAENQKPKEAEGESKVEVGGKIKTAYQKLSGPKATGQKIDLSKFAKKPSAKKTDNKNSDGEKKKRKRIHKDVKFNNSGSRPGGGNNRAGGRGRFQARGQQNKSKDTTELTEEQVSKQIKDTLEKLTNKGKKNQGAKYRREKRQQRKEIEAQELEAQEQDKTLVINEFATVNELSSLMDVSVMDIISTCMSLGIMVTMNQRLDEETIQLVADEFGYEAEFASAEEETEEIEEEDNPEDLELRAPIVTVMGHVDHGKTSLLDYIRKANVIAGESGGITQHIGAYGVELKDGQKIAFLDTPGHAAFTAMRARGANLTDIAIVVVAADDAVMPQTKEAISHAQAAGVPIIFAINKVDKPDANPEKVKEQLAGMNLLVEDWGGEYLSEDVSAKKGLNIDELLEKVILQAEILELKANPNKAAVGTVVEASLDKGRGYVATIMVQAGTLKVGDYVLVGKNHGKVRAMMDERGNLVEQAGPSTPVTILGLDGAPTAGDKFKVYTDEKEAKQLAAKRQQLQREQSIRTQKHLTLDEIGRRIALGDFQQLNIILKGDVDGSVEALTDSLQKLSTDEIVVNILHKGVGQITESDILLAAASEAIVIGFNVRPSSNARDLADKEDVEIRNYSIIYDAINDIKEAMEGMLSPEVKEEVIGNVEIRDTFKVSKVGTIAGCMVISGKVINTAKVRLIREGVVKHDGELSSLKRFKDDAKEVNKGYECGLSIKNYNDILVGDILEVYKEVEVKKKLKS